MEKKPLNKKEKKTAIGCFFTIIFIIIMYFLLKSCCNSIFSLTPAEKQQVKLEKDSTTIKENAIVNAENAIKSELKCPSKAKFDLDNSKIIYFSGDKNGDTIRVLLPFDAQNEFGAYLRDTRFVDIKLAGNINNLDNYEVIRVLSYKEAEKVDDKELGIMPKK
jgi:hypothetical protein